MAKRDYYDVLGVNKSASKDEIKKPIESWLSNIIQIKPKAIKLQKKSLKRQVKLITYFPTKKKNNYDQFGHAAFEGAGAVKALVVSILLLLRYF